MANIFGAIGIPEGDYAYVRTYGQSVVYDATLAILGDHNADIMAAQALFVEAPTKDHKVRYKLPGNGELQRLGRQSEARAIKAGGQWDVAFPLENFGDKIAVDRVTFAYMTVQEYNRHVMTVFKHDTNTVRKEIIRALINPAARTFHDEQWGDLAIQPLANGDATLYPPIIGSIDDSAVNNYLTSGYIPAAISDTNNPVPTMVTQLENHFGTPTGGSNIVVLINPAQTVAIQALSGFDTVPNRFVTYGANSSLVDGFTTGEASAVDVNGESVLLPGRVLGETDSALIIAWAQVPVGFMIAIHLDAQKPLMRRIDPPETGLPDGLALVARDADYPFNEAEWSHRFGFGVGNRLNGVVMQLTAGAYTVPVFYAY